METAPSSADSAAARRLRAPGDHAAAADYRPGFRRSHAALLVGADLRARLPYRQHGIRLPGLGICVRERRRDDSGRHARGPGQPHTPAGAEPGALAGGSSSRASPRSPSSSRPPGTVSRRAPPTSSSWSSALVPSRACWLSAGSRMRCCGAGESIAGSGWEPAPTSSRPLRFSRRSSPTHSLSRYRSLWWVRSSWPAPPHRWTPCSLTCWCRLL